MCLRVLLPLVLLLGAPVDAVRRTVKSAEKTPQPLDPVEKCQVIPHRNQAYVLNVQHEISSEAAKEMQPRDSIEIGDLSKIRYHVAGASNASLAEMSQHSEGDRARCPRQKEIIDRIQAIAQHLDPYKALNLKRKTNSTFRDDEALEQLWKHDAKRYLDETIRRVLWRFEHASWGSEQLWYRIVRFIVASKQFGSMWAKIQKIAAKLPFVVGDRVTFLKKLDRHAMTGRTESVRGKIMAVDYLKENYEFKPDSDGAAHLVDPSEVKGTTSDVKGARFDAIFKQLRVLVEEWLVKLPDIASSSEESYLKIASEYFYTSDSLKVRSSHAMGMVVPGFDNHHEILSNHHVRGLYGMLWYALRMERGGGKSFWGAIESDLHTLSRHRVDSFYWKAYTAFMSEAAPFVNLGHFRAALDANLPRNPCLQGGQIHYKESGKSWAWLHYNAGGGFKAKDYKPQSDAPHTMVNLHFAEPFTRGEKELFYACPSRTVTMLPTRDALRSGEAQREWARGEDMYVGTAQRIPGTSTSWKEWTKHLWMDFDADIGISGTTDLLMAASQYLGFGADELSMLRLSIIGGMIPGRDHALIDIMASAEGFGVPLVPHGTPLVAIMENLLPLGSLPKDLHGNPVQVTNGALNQFLLHEAEKTGVHPPCTTAECLKEKLSKLLGNS